MYKPGYDENGKFIGVYYNEGTFIPNTTENRDYVVFLKWYEAEKEKPFLLEDIVIVVEETKETVEIKEIVSLLTDKDKIALIDHFLAERIKDDPDFLNRAGVTIDIKK